MVFATQRHGTFRAFDRVQLQRAWGHRVATAAMPPGTGSRSCKTCALTLPSVCIPYVITVAGVTAGLRPHPSCIHWRNNMLITILWRLHTSAAVALSASASSTSMCFSRLWSCAGLPSARRPSALLSSRIGQHHC